MRNYLDSQSTHLPQKRVRVHRMGGGTLALARRRGNMIIMSLSRQWMLVNQ